MWERWRCSDLSFSFAFYKQVHAYYAEFLILDKKRDIFQRQIMMTLKNGEKSCSSVQANLKEWTTNGRGRVRGVFRKAGPTHGYGGFP